MLSRRGVEVPFYVKTNRLYLSGLKLLQIVDDNVRVISVLVLKENFDLVNDIVHNVAQIVRRYRKILSTNIVVENLTFFTIVNCK